MDCPECGYALSPLDTECLRCRRRREHPGEVPLPQPVIPASPQAVAEKRRTRMIAIAVAALMILLAGAVVQSSLNRVASGGASGGSSGGDLSPFPPDYGKQHVPTRAERQGMDALLDLQTATQVGVSYGDYGNYVIKAKQELRKAQDAAPMAADMSGFWDHLQRGLDGFENANAIWTEHIKSPGSEGSAVFEKRLQGCWSGASANVDLASCYLAKPR